VFYGSCWADKYPSTMIGKPSLLHNLTSAIRGSGCVLHVHSIIPACYSGVKWWWWKRWLQRDMAVRITCTCFQFAGTDSEGLLDSIDSLKTFISYGPPTNPTRLGGALAYATFPPSSSISPPTVVFRLMAGNATILSLIPDLTANYTIYLSNSSAPPNGLSTPYAPPYTFSDTTGPTTLALSLDPYNNATYSVEEGTPDTPLPVLGTKDAALLECLNTTIGLAALLAKVDFPLPAFFVFWLVLGPLMIYVLLTGLTLLSVEFMEVQHYCMSRSSYL
jgi:hypothetical protein